MLSDDFKIQINVTIVTLPIVGLLNFFYFSSNFLFIFLILFLILIFSLKKIFLFSKKLYDIFLISFFLKILFLLIIFKIGENLNFKNGDIAGSDSQSYFYNSFIIGDISKFKKIFIELVNFEIIFDGSFYFYNYFLKILIPGIKSYQVGILNIFYINFAIIIFFNLLNNISSNTKIIFITTLLLIIDFKILFFSLFNLEESLFILLIITSIYSYLNLTKKINILRNSIYFSVSFILISFLKLYFALLIFIFFFVFSILSFLKNKGKLNKKNFILSTLIFFLMLILFQPLFFNEYLAIKYANVSFVEGSIGSFIMNFDVLSNPLGIIIQFFSAIIGIFPLYKSYTLFIELEKFAVIFFHILLICSIFGLRNIIKDQKLNFEFLFILIFSLIYLFICSIISFGGLEFIRYSLPINFLISYMASFFLKDNPYNKIKSVIVFYLITQISLSGFYHVLKQLIV